MTLLKELALFVKNSTYSIYDFLENTYIDERIRTRFEVNNIIGKLKKNKNLVPSKVEEIVSKGEIRTSCLTNFLRNRKHGAIFRRGENRMKIFDAHCDVLWQLWQAKQKRFANDSSLHITLESLKKSNGKIQCFAIYIPEHVPHEHRFHAALEMVEIFYKEIVDKHPEVKLVLTKQDSQRLQDGDIGALLTLEGCDAIGQSITRLDTLHRLGVRSVGLTWNYSNAVADGALEPRGAGLSSFGIKVVERLNEHSLWTDVSHLSEKGFWDVMEHSEHPIASHSNCHVLREHPRNLKNEQIQALLEKDGMVGVTFVPSFVKEQMPVHIGDVLLHLEHICALGGENNVGFGSDFDGITETVVNLERYTHYENLINELQKHYKEEQVHKFLYSNFADHISF